MAHTNGGSQLFDHPYDRNQRNHLQGDVWVFCRIVVAEVLYLLSIADVLLNALFFYDSKFEERLLTV